MRASTTGNSTIPKSTPGLVSNLSAGYLHTGDLFVQVFPRMNPQVPVKVLVLVLSPTPVHAIPDWIMQMMLPHQVAA